jgi:hypothetical protein
LVISGGGLVDTLDITFIHNGKKVQKQVPISMRISALRAMISRIYCVSVRKKTITISEGDGSAELEIEEGDASRDVGWFVSGQEATIVVS